MVKKWDLIYELRADVERVRLFGGDDSWAAIGNGSIERKTLEGTITEAHPTEFGVQPAFRMLMDDGSELTGVRRGDETRYVEGLRLRLEYVTLERERDAAAELGPTADVVLRVWIEHSHLRTPLRPHSFYASPPGPI
jgi:hypothetical protein